MSNAPTHSVHSAIATGPLLLLLFLLFGCLTPGAAFAVDGYDQLGFRTISDDCGPFLNGKYEAQDASIAYCMNQERPGPTKPGGPWLNFDQGWVWLDDEFAAIVCRISYRHVVWRLPSFTRSCPRRNPVCRMEAKRHYPCRRYLLLHDRSGQNQEWALYH